MGLRKLSSLTTALALVAATAIPGATAFAATDLNGHWAEDEIEALETSGVIQGYPDGTFKPDDPISRAEFVTVFNRAAQLDAVASGGHFADVASDAWYDGQVGVASAIGYITGFEDNTFRPDQPITRNEVAVILARALGLAQTDTPSFSDWEQIPDWAAPSVAAVAAAGYMQGYPDGSFGGDRQVTRAEASILIYRSQAALVSQVPRIETVSVADESGNPVADATVRVHRQGQKTFVDSQETDANGQATFILRPNQYEITVSTSDLAGHQAVSVGTAHGNVQISATKAAILSGRLVDENGQPMAGVVVTFTTNPTFYAITDANGEYRATVLPGRDYEMSVFDSEEDLMDTGTSTSTGGGTGTRAHGRTVGSVSAPAAGEATDLGEAIVPPETGESESPEEPQTPQGSQESQGSQEPQGSQASEQSQESETSESSSGTSSTSRHHHHSGSSSVEYVTIEAATAEDLEVEGFDLDDVNYDLTVAQTDDQVTISGDITKHVSDGEEVTGYGTIEVPAEAVSTEYALIAWMVDDELYVWAIGNETDSFTIDRDSVTYTIDVSGLQWPVAYAATVKNLSVEGFAPDDVNYDLTVEQAGDQVTITGDITKHVSDGEEVAGYGTIEVPATAESTQYALIAWMMDDEMHVWAIGNKTESFSVDWDGVTYTIDVSGLQWPVAYAATVKNLSVEGFAPDDVNYDLTVEQTDDQVTISGEIDKFVLAGEEIAGYGTIEVPADAQSTDYALIAWMMDDELHVWAIGDKTESFKVDWDGVTYTIDVSGLEWQYAAIEAATEEDLQDEGFDLDDVNYDLNVEQTDNQVKISGEITKHVSNGEEVTGFGTIEVPANAQSTEYALIAWMVDDELYVWAIGNETDSFTIERDGATYTIDVSGLQWPVAYAATVKNLSVEGFDPDDVNYDLTVEQTDDQVTISGEIDKFVLAGEEIAGYGTIEVPADAQSTDYALIAWMMDDELHVWAIGDKTESFKVDWDGVTYTIDVSSLEWRAAHAATGTRDPGENQDEVSGSKGQDTTSGSIEPDESADGETDTDN